MSRNEGMSLDELRAQLHTQIREKGVVKRLKTQLRSVILSDLSRKNPINKSPWMPSDLKSQRLFQVGDKLVENYLRQTGRNYTHSLFLSESSVHIGTPEEDDELYQIILGDHKIEQCFKSEQKQHMLATVSCLEIAIETWCQLAGTRTKNICDASVQTEDQLMPLFSSLGNASLQQKLAWVDAHDRARRQTRDCIARSDIEARLRQYELDIKKRLENEAESNLSYHRECVVADALRTSELQHKQLVSKIVLEYTEKEKKLRHEVELMRSNFERRQQELNSKALLMESERQELLTSLRLREHSVQTAMQDAQRLRDNALGSSQRAEYLASIITRQDAEIQQLMTLISDSRHQPVLRHSAPLEETKKPVDGTRRISMEKKLPIKNATGHEQTTPVSCSLSQRQDLSLSYQALADPIAGELVLESFPSKALSSSSCVEQSATSHQRNDGKHATISEVANEPETHGSNVEKLIAMLIDEETGEREALVHESEEKHVENIHLHRQNIENIEASVLASSASAQRELVAHEEQHRRTLSVEYVLLSTLLTKFISVLRCSEVLFQEGAAEKVISTCTSLHHVLELGRKAITDQTFAEMAIIENSFRQQTDMLLKTEAVRRESRKYEVVTSPESSKRDAMLDEEKEAFKYLLYDFNKERMAVGSKTVHRPTFTQEIVITRSSDDDQGADIFKSSSDESF